MPRSLSKESRTEDWIPFTEICFTFMPGWLKKKEEKVVALWSRTVCIPADMAWGQGDVCSEMLQDSRNQEADVTCRVAARANFSDGRERKFRIVRRARVSSHKAALLPREDPPKAEP